jgi:hypothetical protein
MSNFRLIDRQTGFLLPPSVEAPRIGSWVMGTRVG